MQHTTEPTTAPDAGDTTSHRRGRGDRGEGVISTAIAVLIIAFLGVGMWVGFKSIFDDAADSTRTQVEQIGS